MSNKLLFVHDGHIFKSDNKLFSGVYNQKIIDRYCKLADSVTFLVRTGTGKNFEKLNEISADNLQFKGIENFKSLKSLLKYFDAKKIIEEEVRNADFVIARLPSDLGFMSIESAKKFNKKYLIEVVGCPWDSLRNHSIKGKLVAPIYYLKQKSLVKKSNKTVYVTNVFLQNRYPSKGEILSCSDVVIENDKYEVLEKRLKKIKSFSTEKIVIGSIGPLDMKYKGFDTVIQAISLLNKQGCNFTYEIIGNGNSEWIDKVIKKYGVETKVKKIPAMPHSDVFKWLDSIDLYIQPSKTEGMPRALIEAISRGLPSIGTKVGGIPELLHEEYLFKTKNVSELVRILKELTIENLEEQAILNYYTSNQYKTEKLEAKRNRYYGEFLKEAKY